MVSYNIPSRKRPIAMPASSCVRMSWSALPVLTGDVRPDAFGQLAMAATDARTTTPGHLAWSPPI